MVKFLKVLQISVTQKSEPDNSGELESLGELKDGKMTIDFEGEVEGKMFISFGGESAKVTTDKAFKESGIAGSKMEERPMKRIFLCLILVLLFVPSVMAASGVRNFSAAELKLMSTFLSNFTELGFFDFDAATLLKSDAIVRFGVWNNYVNNYRSRIAECRVKNCPHGSLVIDAKYVAESIKKYFDADFKDHRSVKPDYEFYKEYEFYYDGALYHFEGADGEAVYHARVDRAVQNSSGQIVMTGELFNADDEDDKLGKFEAVAKPYKFGGRDTWAIIAMRTERNK